MDAPGLHEDMQMRAKRDIRRLLARVWLSASSPVVGDWVIQHWHLTGRAADVVVFVTVFVAIGALSYSFGRQR